MGTVNKTGLLSAKVTVTTAGTRVQLSTSSIAVSFLAIQTPPTGNTGNIFVGGVDVNSTNGYVLASTGEAIILSRSFLGGSGEELRLDQIYVDAQAGGDGNTVRILYDKKVSVSI